MMQVLNLGLQPYEPVWRAMQRYTDQRNANTADQLWLVEHHPVFTQGMNGLAEHILDAGDIPVIVTDRGGQVTYHGPGQLVVYFLLDIKRLGQGVRFIINTIEQSLIDLLASYQISAYGDPQAPGVYTAKGKIASLGLRVRKGCSYHGLSLNVSMDLQPFQRINPCGYVGMAMTRLHDFGYDDSVSQVAQRWLEHLPTALPIQRPMINRSNFLENN